MRQRHIRMYYIYIQYIQYMYIYAIVIYIYIYIHIYILMCVAPSLRVGVRGHISAHADRARAASSARAWARP